LLPLSLLILEEDCYIQADGMVKVWDLTVTRWLALPLGTVETDLTVQVEARTGMRLDQTRAFVPLSRLSHFPKVLPLLALN
jgi:hypothetical protein